MSTGPAAALTSMPTEQTAGLLETRRKDRVQKTLPKRAFKITRERSKNPSIKKKNPPISPGCVVVDNSQSRQEALKQAIYQLGWKECRVRPKMNSCDIFWQLYHYHHPPHDGVCSINKFPRMSDLLHKISLTRNLMNMQKLYPEEYNFFPHTWFLPEEFHEFSAHAAYERRKDKRKPKRTYIVKPDNGTHGDGIYLIKDPNDILAFPSSKKHVVQEYVSNPLLVENTKFDLRVYVVLVSLDPLKIYLSQEGLARFCTVKYQPPANKNIQDSFMHLTNYSLNKASKSYIHNNRLDSGSKRTLTSVFSKLSARGHDTAYIWAKIEQVAIKTILAILPELKIAKAQTIPSHSKLECFQILGFDILLTDAPELEAILLEVNACPSLSLTFDEETDDGMVEVSRSAVDEYVKINLVRETLQLVCPRPRQLRKSRSDENSELKDRRSHSRVRGRLNTNDHNGDAKKRSRRARSVGPGVMRANEMESDGEEEEMIRLLENALYTDGTARESEGDSASHTDTGGTGEEGGSDGPVNDLKLPDFSTPDPARFLYEVFPGPYEEKYTGMNVMDRLAVLYQKSLGVRKTSAMSSNHFRMFARKSKLDTLSSSLTVAAIDILYIELQQKWERLQPQSYELGLCFLGFVDGFLILASRSMKIRSDDRQEMVNKVLSFCETNILQASTKKYLPVLSLEQKQQMRLKSLFNHACDIDRQLSELRASMKSRNQHRGVGREGETTWESQNRDQRKPPFNLYRQAKDSSKCISFEQFKRSLNWQPRGPAGSVSLALPNSTDST